MGRRRRGVLARRRLNLFDPAVITTSFEDGTTLGWANYLNVASLASVVGNAGHGSRSMRVTGSAAGTVSVSDTVFVPCLPSLKYSFGFHAVSSLSFQIFIYWHTAANVYLGASSGSLGAPPGSAGRLTLSNITPPASSAKFFISIEALSVPAGGTFNLDAIQCESGPVASAYEG